jgi:O-antigen ligase
MCLMTWFVLRTRHDSSRRRLAVAGLLVIGVVSLGWAGLDTVADRFAQGPGNRLDVWTDTLHIVRDFPLTGTGLNTYDTAMAGYEVLDVLYARDAHNDYLEVVSDGGLLVGLPALLLLLLVIVEARRRLKAEHDSRMRWIRLGALTGMVGIAAQELVEFSLQIPANAVLFTVLCGLALREAEEP